VKWPGEAVQRLYQAIFRRGRRGDGRCRQAVVTSAETGSLAV
jgi:hypothetical protein